jgi:triose/dihydroxyacetone kinase / FAD-AMP lyase (cyclizing)
MTYPWGVGRGGKVGRRGLAGTVLMHKIFGATSSVFRKSFQDTVRLGRKVAENLVTVTAFLDHVYIPGQPGRTHQHLEDDQMELEIGIHDEPGCQLLCLRPSFGCAAGDYVQPVTPHRGQRPWLRGQLRLRSRGCP